MPSQHELGVILENEMSGHWSFQQMSAVWPKISLILIALEKKICILGI